MARLFTSEFVQSVAHLRLLARQAAPGGRHGEHGSRDLGAGMEFRDFRTYVPGDDLRRVDWNIYRRSGRLFLRLLEEPRDQPMHILIDVSDSMYFESPPRADAARLVAGALAVIRLNQHDRVSVQPIGNDMIGQPLMVSGSHGLSRVLSFIEGLEASGETDMVSALRRFSSLRTRPGLAVIVSDFFDQRGIETVLDALRPCRHRLLMVQVARKTDADPGLQGELRLIDCEGGAGIDVTVTEPMLIAYRRAYAAFEQRLMRFVAMRQAAHLLLDADEPVLEQLSGLFAGNVLSV